MTTNETNLPDAPLSKKVVPLSALQALMPFIRPYRLQIFFASIALLFTSGVMLSMGKGLQFLIDGGIASGSEAALTQAVLVFVGLIALLSIGSFCRFYLVSWIGERVVADIRSAVFGHLIQMHPGYFESNQASEIQSRITADTTLLQSVIGSSVSIALRNFVMLLGGVILLVITNPKLTAIVLISVPLVIGPILFFGRRVRKLSKTTQDEIANVGGYVGEALRNIKVVQGHNHQKEDIQRFDVVVDRAFLVSVQRIKQRAFLSVIVIMLSMGAIGGMIWVGGNDVIQGTISGGDLASFLFYAVVVAGSVAAISEVMGELQRAAGATERLIELLTTPSDIVSFAKPTAGSDDFISAAFEDQESNTTLPIPLIAFEKVSFHYHSRPNQLAVNEFTFSMHSGETIAIVGPSGAGKSTLFELLLRFYDVNKGRICLQGDDIRSLSLEVLRENMAIVPQQPSLFHTSVADNIAYGDRRANREQIIEAAKAAYAHDFIQDLPDGYDSELGENGVRLSGGQKQRIAIARAILKNAPILLLDEATSALDAESEHQVQQALEQLMQGRTTFIIAHRLATVLNADRTLVLDKGQLVAVGRHRDLIKTSPLYARLAELQFDGHGLNKEEAKIILNPTQSS